MSLERRQDRADDHVMRRAVLLSALIAVSMSLAACGGASYTQDAAYVRIHFANPRVQPCLMRGKHVISEKTKGAALQAGWWSASALRGVVLCMQRRLAHQ
jgi:hypothetical protein